MASPDVPALSAEILAHIFGYHSSSQSVLRELCLVSRSFNAFATPLLYRAYRAGNSLGPSGTDYLYAFLRTIIQRPDLGSHVKHVSVGAMASNEPFYKMMDAALLELCTQRIDKMCSGWLAGGIDEGFRDSWVDLIENATPYAVMTILLYSLPNIETLFFEESYEPEIFWTTLGVAVPKLQDAHARGEAPPAQVPFSKLHSFRSLSTERKYGYLCFHALCPFFALPTIRAFEIALANGEWRDDENAEAANWKVALRSSKVERLSFQHSALTQVCLEKVLNSCAHLQEFHYTYGAMHMYGQDFTPMDLLRQLLNHVDTLETLVLNYDDDWQKVLWEEIDDAELYFNRDLQRLAKLRKLSVNCSALFGIIAPEAGKYDSELDHREAPTDIHLPERLPESLEEFEVVCCDERLVPHLQQLAEARSKGRYPRLRRICCKMVQEQVDEEDITEVEIPGVELAFEFLESNDRTNLIYDTTGHELYGSSHIFDNPYLLGHDC